MAQAIANVYDANMEVVRKAVLPRIYPMSNTVSAKILGNLEKHQITKTPNGTDFRAPIEVSQSAQFGGFSLAGGSLGLGGSFNLAQLVQTTVPMKLGFQINADAKIGTANASLSTANAFKKSMKDAVPLVQHYDDVSFFNIGGSQGIIAVSTGISGTTIYQLDTDFGANLIIPGMVFEVFSSDLSVQKTATTTVDALPYAKAVDYLSRTVTIDSAAKVTGGIAAGDKLLFQGAVANSTVPAWMNGLQYVNDGATSGTYLGLDRATYPQIVATNYAANSTLTPQMGILMKHRIMLRNGELPKDLVGIINVAQHAAILSTGINISMWYRTAKAGSEKPLDIAPEVEDTVDFCGVPTYVSTHQSQSRIDYVRKSDWGRVWFGNTTQWDFWTDESGRRVFPLTSSNGAPAASELFYLWSAQNMYNVSPGRAGYISSLSLPTGY